MKKVVVIGGGTGTFVVLSALKKIPNLDVSAIVTMADSGGSTGRLRDEFGFQPVGDLRQALAALAQENGQQWIQKLLLYRFSRGSGLEGHNLGNLILTALQDMTGSTAKAAEVASKIFRLEGHIYPITTTNVQLVVEYDDGTVAIGEHILDQPDRYGGKRITSVKTSPTAAIYSQARQAIEGADVIIIGPGDLYGSILPNFIVQGARDTVRRSRGRFVFVMNLMTRFTQTHGMTASDHVREVERYLGRSADAVILNTAAASSRVLAVYERQHEFPVKDDLARLHEKTVIRKPLIRSSKVTSQPGDVVPRSYLRHDPMKLRKVFEDLIP